MTDLHEYGLNEQIENAAAEYAASGSSPEHEIFRVISQEKGLYRVVGENGFRNAEISGKLRFSAVGSPELPAVGDFVMAADGGETAVIHRVLPRRSVFIRKAAGTAVNGQVIAANIDTVFLCMSLNSDFNLRRLERYLSIAWESGASPVIVLTKSDLCADLADKLGAVDSVAAGVDVVVTSAERGKFGKLTSYLRKGRTAALIGSSGVGKSTLINCLLGEQRLETNGLRDDGKGRHTTTRRELILLQNGILIDTPGMRELGMWDSADGLDRTFADITQLALSCRYRDCTHTNEPDCAVRAAIESGALPSERWQSYLKLKGENDYISDSAAYLADKEKKFREIAKYNKHNKKR